MKKFLKISALCLFPILGSGFWFDFNLFDDAFIKELKNKLNLYNTSFTEEKVYLHFDKPFYKPDDDIWFSAKVLKSTDHSASNISSILHVELLNPRGSVEQKMDISIENGVAKGDFKLNANAVGGLYKIKAYTNFQKNAGENTFFEKTLQVQKFIKPKMLLTLDFEKKSYTKNDLVMAILKAKNIGNEPITDNEFNYTIQLEGKQILAKTAKTDKEGNAKIAFQLPTKIEKADGLINIIVENRGIKESISRSVPIVLNNIDMLFFPEGGNLVENAENRVAFKAMNEFSKAAEVEGVVLDEKNKEVARFSSFYQGMGDFALPKANEGTFYRVRLTKPASDREYALPQVEKNNYTLHINNENIQKNQLNVSFNAPKSGTVHIVAQTRGLVQYTNTIQAREGKNTLEINAKNFPIGVAQITLFDAQKTPKAERIVFVGNANQLNIKLSSNKKTYMPRERVEISVETTDENGNAIPANLSLSVLNDKVVSFADDKQDNLLSYMLLSSDVKGEIDEPAFYFKKDEPKAKKALNYLLMTQGWRRFSWDKVLDKNPVWNVLAEKTQIKGTLRDYYSNNTKDFKDADIQITLLEISGQKRIFRKKVASNGTFEFDNIDANVPVQLFAHNKNGNIQQYYQIELENTGFSNRNVDYASRALQGRIAGLQITKEGSGVMRGGNDNTKTMNMLPSSVAPKVDASPVVVEEVEENVAGDVETEILEAPRERDKMIVAKDEAKKGKRIASGMISRETTSDMSYDDEYNNMPIIINKKVVNNIPFEVLSKENIASMDTISTENARKLYGSQIYQSNDKSLVITTKNEVTKSNYTMFKSMYLTPSVAPTREFYAQKVADAQSIERTDFRETLYFNPSLQTDKNGKATFFFFNSDEETTFRVVAEGFAKNGSLGQNDHTFAVQMPFSLDIKIPAYLSGGDTLNLPIVIKNNTENSVKGILGMNTPERFRLIGANAREVSLNAKEVKTEYMKVVVENLAGTEKLRFNFAGNGAYDAITQEIEVCAKGFPVSASFSGDALDKSFNFNINEPLAKTIKAELTAYLSVLSDLTEGMESIFREPHGCFEQTSSSTYPNILALNFLQETGDPNPAITKKALDYIDKGYKRLIGFESKSGGFEIFGGDPGSERLTAYGLMEFSDMKKVYNNVDEKMFMRNKTWLLSKRNSKGTFTANMTSGYDQKYKEMINAYIVYALSEIGEKNIDLEFLTAYKEAVKSEDNYQIGLMANAAFNLNKKTEGQNLLNIFRKNLPKQAIGKLAAQTSMTYSDGGALQVEISALLAMAMQKANNEGVTNNKKELYDLMSYIIQMRQKGGFYSTQATILALKAIVGYEKFTRKTRENGIITVFVNGKEAGKQAYQATDKSKITISGLEKYMQEGKQDMRVMFSGVKSGVPYSVDVAWNSFTPNSSKKCKLDINTTIAAKSINTNQTLRLTTTLRNTTNDVQPTPMAIVGIPAGLSAQAWQLKELQEKGVFDYYEVRKNYVVFYYREIRPNEVKTVNLDLKADVSGNYTAPASVAYLYYASEFKDWQAGEKVSVLK